ncbi:MAG: hypothetical protein JSR89_03930 [Proteobacteria bacterium]|nr:hypothetical protein [Pseudomonadota bacterium]
MAFPNPRPFESEPPSQDFSSALKLLQQSQRQDSEIALQALERSKQYATLVVSLGYAGIFAIWSFCVGYLPHGVSSATALLVGTSLALFVVFEIMKMFAMQTVAMRLFNSVNLKPNVHDLDGLLRFVDEQKRRQETAAEENFDLSKKLIAIWPYFFFPTVFFGFGGMFLLFYNLAAHLTQALPFFPA